jgi:hypothetical protein
MRTGYRFATIFRKVPWSLPEDSSQSIADIVLLKLCHLKKYFTRKYREYRK